MPLPLYSNDYAEKNIITDCYIHLLLILYFHLNKLLLLVCYHGFLTPYCYCYCYCIELSVFGILSKSEKK